VTRPPCRRWDGAAGALTGEVVPAEARVPLVSALDLGGPQCAVRVVQQLTGLSVTRYVGLDVAGVAPLVDALDGVEVCVDRPVVDALLGPVVPVAGPRRWTGCAPATSSPPAATPASGRCRSAGPGCSSRRWATCSPPTSCSARPGPVPSPTRSAACWRWTARTSTGCSPPDSRCAAPRPPTPPGRPCPPTPGPTDAGPSGQGGAVLREAEAADLFAVLRAGEPVPEQAVLAAAGTPEPVEVGVEVLNASGRPGLATEVGGTLGGLGFTVTGVGNADPAEATGSFSPDRAAAAQVLAVAVPSAVGTPDPGATGMLQLVLGRGFDDVVRAPVAPTATAAPAAPGPCG